MTEANRGFTEVPGLIAERRRYESWLAALEARRESTPGHVFDRVQADYRARLQRVAEELASHRQAIEEERTSVESRVSLLEAEDRMRRDERAELELRSHVGELAGEEASVAFSAVDEAIAQLEGEKAGLRARIVELDALLETPERSAPPPPPPPPTPAEPARSSASVNQALAQTEPVAAAPEAAAGPPGRITASVPRHSGPSAEAVQTARAVDNNAPAQTGSPVLSAPAVQAPAATAAAGAGQRPSGLRTPSGSFDELKFLSTLIGKEPAGRVSGQSGQESPAAATEGNTREPRDGAVSRPLAANVPGNTPIVLRPSVTLDQAKTLKCSECGATNYPTEWYCERCGAELAAL